MTKIVNRLSNAADFYRDLIKQAEEQGGAELKTGQLRTAAKGVTALLKQDGMQINERMLDVIDADAKSRCRVVFAMLAKRLGELGKAVDLTPKKGETDVVKSLRALLHREPDEGTAQYNQLKQALNDVFHQLKSDVMHERELSHLSNAKVSTDPIALRKDGVTFKIVPRDINFGEIAYMDVQVYEAPPDMRRPEQKPTLLLDKRGNNSKKETILLTQVVPNDLTTLSVWAGRAKIPEVVFPEEEKAVNPFVNAIGDQRREEGMDLSGAPDNDSGKQMLQREYDDKVAGLEAVKTALADAVIEVRDNLRKEALDKAQLLYAALNGEVVKKLDKKVVQEFNQRINDWIPEASINDWMAEA